MDAPAETSVETGPQRGRDDETKTQLRGSSLLLAGRVLSLGINLVVQVLIVRYLTKSDFGAYAYALSIAVFAQSVITFGLDRAVTRFIPIYEERREYDKVFGTLVLVTGTILSLGLALILLAWGLQGIIRGTFSDDARTVTLILILIFLAPLQAIDNLQTGLFAVFSRPRAIFFRKYVLAPAFRLGVVLFVIGFGLDVFWLAGASVVAGAIAVGIYSVLLYGEISRQGLLPHFHFKTMTVPAGEVFRFTVPLLSSDMLYAVMHTSDVTLLGRYGGADDVGAFRVISPLAAMNQIVLSTFSMLYTPLAARLYARSDHKGMDEVYWGTAIWTAVLSFPVFALTFSLAEPLTVLFFGERYADSALYLTLLSLGTYFQAALGHNGLTLKVFGLLRYIVTINVLAMVVNLAVNIVLIPRYGPLGAAIGTTATLVVHNILKQVGLRRIGIRVFAWPYARVYASIVLGAGGLLAIQLALSPSAVVGFVLAAIVSFAVVAVNRRDLRVGHTFPELMRFRAIRMIVGEP